MRNYFTSTATVLVLASVQARKDLGVLLQQMAFFSDIKALENVSQLLGSGLLEARAESEQDYAAWCPPWREALQGASPLLCSVYAHSAQQWLRFMIALFFFL